jgi:hypothetical protein
MSEVDAALRILELDRTTGTLLVSDDVTVRHFIAESLLIAAGVFLLRTYATGYLRGIGLSELAEEHGRKSRDMLKKIRAGKIEEEDLELMKADTVELCGLIPKQKLEEAKEPERLAESEVSKVLINEGAPSTKALAIAARATLAVRGLS